MFRKIVILILTLFFMALIIFTAVMFLKNEEILYTHEDIELSIDKPTFITVGEAQTETDGSVTTDIYPLTFLTLSIGSLAITEETLPNGDVLLFDKVENTGWMPFTFSMNRSGVEDATITRWNEDTMLQQEEETYGTDATRNPFGVIRTADTETLQGNIYVSRGLSLGNGERVKELRHEIYDFPVEEGVMEKSLWLPPKHQSESWMLISSEALFDSAETETEWVQFANANRRAQFNWLTPDGPRQKMALTDDLRTELAYTIPEQPESVYREWFEQTSSRFFDSMSQYLTE
ncbi:hypothetical protein KQ939_05110 [Planococcus sp. CP5-4]|uniref:hypothetical protein n=1 Tax=unclassified Planococcus (in: firmicutes) TaxID=2662419 RepID=UPI001C242204|nr:MULTISPECIES: hypothetical protein [unclassified Planococcus (in: firmicutes)]MBU9673639.1 hypothetical protein [Planococcus sp. CP5-4_YE]MBV0907929.1 hypothetical protein [Planococcus sp. CP5-4_UN]MBW6063096.1 hypothetical protein [Planococcus sp. CP5-4]